MLRTGRCPLILIALLPLTVAEAHAQRLLESDGIQLRGTARIVTYGAGTCNVAEDRETAVAYERKKANHGRPVDVWQLDFSVYNGSGRYLDHLIARYQIASEWPPCTNWSGPSGTYAEPVQSSSTAGHIQESGRNVVAPDETLTKTVFLVVFHEHEPRFDNWSLDYDFGQTAVATTGSRPDVQQRRPEPRAEATPEARATDESPGSQEGALPLGIRDGETCRGAAAGTACWMELANQPGCYLWNPSLHSGATATWNSRCSGGFGQGLGVIEWVYDGGEQISEGSLVDGKQHGRWVVQYEDGDVGEGPYVNGKATGDWVYRRPDGRESRGPLVDGNRHGRWIEQHEDGNVGEGPYVNGKATGDWVYRYPDGRESRGPLVDGDKHGRWVEQYESGTVGEGPYVNGEANGDWIYRYPDGREDRGPIVDGNKYGRWVEQHESGTVSEGPYVNGKAHGIWILRRPGEWTCSVQFVAGQPQGKCET